MQFAFSKCLNQYSPKQYGPDNNNNDNDNNIINNDNYYDNNNNLHFTRVTHSNKGFDFHWQLGDNQIMG